METTIDMSTEMIAISILSILWIILFVWLIVISVKFKKVKTKYNSFIAGQGVHDLENVVIAIQEKIQLNGTQLQQIEEQLQTVQQRMPLQKSKVGIVRFNPFGETGHNLSFAIAIINEQQDGIVLSAIHNRENSIVYAKPISQGQSTYKLTPEELEAVEQAN
ncbi:DUF4446 family protein [Paenibacillus yanchengensis]|uniref:DUF4446 family protein n=1 Tax=Paenibacillus yanchengensis TaxID=2035833 RepID=A0ABW4YP95_9BACL